MKAVLLATLALGLLLASSARAAVPPAGVLVAPSTPGSVSTTWTGTVNPGTGSLAVCAGGVNADLYRLTVDLPPAGPGPPSGSSGSFYTGGREGFLSIRIDWAVPPGGDINTQDLALLVVDPNGNQVSSDGGAPREAVSFVNPVEGVYRVFTCAFLVVLPQPYSGQATLTISQSEGSTNPPSSGTNNVRFSPIVTVGPQRDVAEPNLRIDGKNNEYACGPFGASRAIDFAWKSEDRGDTFRILGTPPEGRISPGGGGDCEFGMSPKPDAMGNYTLSYTGLEALINFSTARSQDEGRSFVGTNSSQSPVVVDRQWMDAADANKVYLTYRQIPLGSIVQKSTTGGLTYNVALGVAVPEISISGNIIVDNQDATGETIYLIHTFGNEVRVAKSTNGGATTPFPKTTVVNAAGDPSSIFPAIAQDTAGNLYAVWTEGGSYNTYYSVSTDGGATWRAKVQANRDNVHSTVLPWIDAGAPGRIAISYYGSVVDGNPEIGTFRGPWDVYVNTVYNALSTTPSVAQVKATTHPIHWDSICISGLACSLTGGDRTLLDFFQTRHDTRGALRLTYNESNKEYGESVGPIAIVTYSKQIGGPTLNGGFVSDPGRPVVDVFRSDREGDAQFPFSVLGPAALPRTNFPALDLLEMRAAAGNTSSGPGVTFTMKLKDLSATALTTAQAVTGSNLLYVARFFSGYEAHAAVASYDAVRGWMFGYADNGNCLTAGGACPALSIDGKLEVYPLVTPIAGAVTGNEIRMTVPFTAIPFVGVASPPQNQPTERRATTGDRIYEVTGFTFGNEFGNPALQYYLNQGDSTYSFDYNLGTTIGPPPPMDPAVVMTKTGPPTSKTGTVYTYQINYRNLGPNPSQNAKVVDTLPPQLRFFGASSGGRYDSSTGKVTWNLGTVASDGSGTLTLRAAINAGTPAGSVVVNRAEFTGDLTVSPPTAQWATTVAP